MITRDAAPDLFPNIRMLHHGKENTVQGLYAAKTNEII